MITSRDVVFDATVETTVEEGSGVVVEMVAVGEKLGDAPPMNTTLGQQESRDLHSQHSNYRIPERLNEEETEGITTPPPTSTIRKSTASNDNKIEDSITLRAPEATISTSSQSRKHPGPPGKAENIESPQSTISQNWPKEADGSKRPLRTRRPIDLFKPASWKALVARTNEEPQTLADALASPDLMDWKRA